jgi:hypothetical protein
MQTGHRFPDILLGSGIPANGSSARAEVRCQFRATVGIAVEDDDPGAATDQMADGRLAEPGCTSGDERDIRIQFHDAPGAIGGQHTASPSL